MSELVTEPTRDDFILRLIEKATKDPRTGDIGLVGGHGLQKGVYFFNLRFNLFLYKWAAQGPFCDEVDQIVSWLYACRLIKVTPATLKPDGRHIRNITFDDTCDSIFSERIFPKEIDEEIDRTIRFTYGKSSSEIELLASVHYLATIQTRSYDKYTSEYIYDTISKLKPSREYTQKEIEDTISILESNHYLKAPESQ